MAAQSSILAWEIPWTAEPGWLQSMGSRSVGQDLARTLSKKVQTIETTNGARGGPPKQTFGASESAYLAGIPSPRGKETDTRKVLRTRDERPSGGALDEGVPGGAPTRAPSSPGPGSGLQPTPGARRARGPERRPGSVRATRPARPVEPRPRLGGSCRGGPSCSAAARSFGVVRDRGAALPPNSAPGPALPRPRSPVRLEPGTGLRGRRGEGVEAREGRGPGRRGHRRAERGTGKATGSGARGVGGPSWRRPRRLGLSRVGGLRLPAPGSEGGNLERLAAAGSACPRRCARPRAPRPRPHPSRNPPL